MTSSGGTEYFPDLGRHCQFTDCFQLDFLPFNCDACRKDFCVEHKSFKSHECPNFDIHSRKVLVCEICSTSIETTGSDEKTLLEKHKQSGDCDPKKKERPTCSVKRCKKILTISNTSVCKTCNAKVCLKHRFHADHACNSNKNSLSMSSAKISREMNNMFLVALASRNGKDCGENKIRESTSPPSTPTVKAY